VLGRLYKLNVNKSECPDLIHPKNIYEIRHKIVYPLILLFNRPFENKQIPKLGKCANIYPIFKKGRKDKNNNYRPVSFTWIICKIMESIDRNKIMDHFVINKLFTNRQCGFLKGWSTVTQLLQILYDWIEILQSGGRTDVIYRDFEKAFDKVPHR